MTPPEPGISINGRALSEAEAMTFRVALETFAMGLGEPDALGADDHGREMVRLYRERIASIRQAMGAKKPAKEPEFAAAADEVDHLRVQLGKLKDDGEQLVAVLKQIIAEPESDTRMGLIRSFNRMKSAARSGLLRTGVL